MKNKLVGMFVCMLLFFGMIISSSSDVIFYEQSTIMTSLGSDHQPIYIEGNDNFTQENGVTDGSGTEEDPYIIENWIIENDNTTDNGIFINNTDMNFIIRGCQSSYLYSLRNSRTFY